jgi:large-conductance mechanosensitive channel
MRRVEAAVWKWEEWKQFLEHSIAFSSDALHVIVGVVILLAVAVLIQKPVSSVWPLLSVLILELLNEAADLTLEWWPHRGMQYGESMRDVILTMVLPTVLFLSTRIRPQIFARRGLSSR